MLWNTMIDFLKSWFIYDGLEWKLLLVAIGLALGFGIIWLLAYWPPVFKKIWFWPVMVVSAFLTLLAITFIQIPLQDVIQRAFNNNMGQGTILDWYLLTGIPTVVVSGLVQEASKLVPVAFWRWRSGNSITPRMGLLIGAIAGAGFGIFEAFWVHGSVFSAGWTTQLIAEYGFDGIAAFWERFFTVGFHIAVSALAGYGLSKGKWWQYYLIAAGLHSLLNYSAVFMTYFGYIQPAAWLKIIYIEMYLTIITVAATAVVLVLRWRKDNEVTAIVPVETPEIAAPGPIEPGV